MSDRIDELVVRLHRHHYTCDEDQWYSCPASGENSRDGIGNECWCGADEANAALAELATIAREAEAMCEWLAEEVAMGRHDTVDNVLDAAREAVTRDER